MQEIAPACLEAYSAALESLTAENLNALRGLTAAQIVFTDPFNNLQGQDDFIALLAEMFAQLNEVRFEIQHQQLQGCCGYLHWRFSACSKRLGTIAFEGVSRVVFDARGLVIEHHDFWDASALLQRMPLLGSVIKIIRKRLGYAAAGN